MKNHKIVLIILLLLTIACHDPFEVSNSSFVKVYGENLDAEPYGFFQKEDGGYVIYGFVNKNLGGGGFIESKHIPTIIVTDEFGNQILSRQYPIEDVEFKNSQASGIKFPVEGARFESMVPLANGDFFAALGAWIPPRILPGGFRSPHYMILDENFNIKHYGNFNDYENPISFIHFAPEAFNIPGSTDVLILMRLSRNIAGFTVDFNTNHYAFYRFSMGGKLIKVNSIDFKYNKFPSDLIFDDLGNIIVIGNDYSESCRRSFIDVIDINTLEVLNNYTISPQGESHRAVSIVKKSDGYVIKDYSLDKETCTPYDPDNNEAIITLRFFDKDFNQTAEPLEVARGSISTFGINNLIQSQDGGFVIGYTDSVEGVARKNAVVIKTDKDGVLLWSYSEPHGFISNGLIEDHDGGIVFIVYKDFNITDFKWYMIKLTKDGRLD